MKIWNNFNLKPMLLKEIDKPFDSDKYIFELKFDGMRALIFVNQNKINIISRNNKDITYLFPELESIKNIVTTNTVFDGEIIALENNKPSFSKLQNRIHLKDKQKIKHAAINNPITFICFDIIYENKNLTNLPLLKRKKILNTYPNTNEFIKTKYISENGTNLFNQIKKNNLEGIVAKLKTGKYHLNKRTDDFIKIKNIKKDTFYITSYEIKKTNLSLNLAEKINNDYKPVGKCPISINNPETKIIMNSKLPIPCTIEYLEKNKNLRHPIFKGLTKEI